VLGTYQSTLTDLPYLSKEWRDNCEAERLLGVSITGQWDSNAARDPETLSMMRMETIKTNKKYAKRFGINESTATLLLAEIGNDMTRWKTWRHFGSWLALAPSSAQSGKMKRRLKRHLTPAGAILCRAVQCMGGGKHTWLASFYKRLRAKRGPKVEVKATAYKVAKLIYLVLTQGWEYVEAGIKQYEQRVRETQVKALKRLAKRLNFQIVETVA